MRMATELPRQAAVAYRRQSLIQQTSGRFDAWQRPDATGSNVLLLTVNRLFRV